MQYFADVLLPLALPKPYTYAVADEDFARLKPGFRVAVTFGKSKIYTGLVLNLHRRAPQRYTAKFIEMVLEDTPTVSTQQIEFWYWLSNYYQSKLGEIMRAALPTTFLLESETVIVKKELSEDQITQLNDDAFLINEALQVKALSIKEVMEVLGKKSVLPLLQQMVGKELIDIHQKLNEKFKPKWVRYVRLSPHYANPEAVGQLFENLKNAPKQKQLLLGLFDQNPKGEQWKKWRELQQKTQIGASILKSLVAKGWVEEKFFQEDRMLYTFDKIRVQKQLTPFQKEAVLTIKRKFEEQSVVLLQGVTGSGKTEVYIELIEQVLGQGQQVLYLLPEISLTPQLVQRLQERFGTKVTVYHSKFSIHERTEIWNKIKNPSNEASIIVGTRSALFLPFQSLGLIVVDEEHELSYKQFDPAPRYHARDSAIVLAGIHQAKVLLGSATPALESALNRNLEKYGWVTLYQRFGNVDLPEIITIDLKLAHQKKQIKGGFSMELIKAMEDTLAMGKQIILFQNQRGYAPVLECLDCGHMPQCHQCDVTLTHHQHSQQLKCHYCGHYIALPIKCHACGLPNLSTKGIGTQQIEEQVKLLFPEISVARMDWDTTRGKWAFDKLIHSFAAQEIQILVGTQMIVKGLDFENVHLVGVLNADHLLNFPDFRAHERSYQMLCQVAGRAGRKGSRGKVLIQTYQPEHPILQQVVAGDYEAMLQQELTQRKHYHYPPFTRLIRIEIGHSDLETVKNASQWFANVLKQSISGQILGPVFPAVARIRNRYRMQLLVKIGENQSRQKVKKIISKTMESFEAISNFRACKVKLDVDPY